MYQTFLSNGTDSCALLLPTHCHIVIVHVHGGDPGCHVGMISPHLFGFKNLSSVLVKALAKHKLYRSEADSRYMVLKKKTHIFFKHREQNVLSNILRRRKRSYVHKDCLQQRFPNFWSVTTLKAMSTHNPSSQVGYVLSCEQLPKSPLRLFHLNHFRRLRR